MPKWITLFFLAISSDGVHWQKAASNPVLRSRADRWNVLYEQNDRIYRAVLTRQERSRSQP